jgi:DNA-binding LacI/PurR family transcriptional regulator
LIAFVTRGFDSETHLLLLNGAEDEAKANGYSVIFSNAQHHDEEIQTLKRLEDEDVAGVLLWPNADVAQARQPNAIEYQELRLPIVFMDRAIYGLDRDCVTSDNYGGAQALMRHFIELGHRHIVFLSHHEMGLRPVSERYRAYHDVLVENGWTPIPPWLIGQPGHEIGASYTLRSSVNSRSPELHQIKDYMLNAQPRPTAIFALNDYLAVLAMQAMKQLDLPVPDAVSIGGFDDIDLAVHLEIPLTTVAQDCIAIGKRAAQLLIARLEGYSGPTNYDIIPTQLRIRSSTSVPVPV